MSVLEAISTASTSLSWIASSALGVSTSAVLSGDFARRIVINIKNGYQAGIGAGVDVVGVKTTDPAGTDQGETEHDKAPLGSEKRQSLWNTRSDWQKV